MSTAVQIEIAAPSETVWCVVTDLEALPETSRFVKTVEILDNTATEGVVVGTKWREVRQRGMEERTMEQIKTVMRMEKEPLSLSVNVSFPKGDGTSGTEDIVNTCSWTVQPISRNKTILICSIAFDSAQGWERCCQPLMLHYARRYVMEELQDYKQTALKRQQGQKQ